MTNPFVTVAQVQVDMLLQWLGLWNRIFEVSLRNQGATPMAAPATTNKAAPAATDIAAVPAAAGRRRRKSCIGPADLRDMAT